MESSQQVKQRIGYLAIDIERTGKHRKDKTRKIEGNKYRNDKTFAIGWAISDKDLKTISTGNICLNLNLGPDFTEDVIFEKWDTNGFEMRCFNEIWGKNLNILQKLQDPSQVNLVETEAEMAAAFNQALLDAEAAYDQIYILTDTTSFDTVWCTLLLLDNGYEPLSLTRAGKYRSGYEIDSYIMGVLKLAPDTPWSEYKEVFDNTIGKIFPEIEVVHDHHPENDAKSILVKFIRALNY